MAKKDNASDYEGLAIGFVLARGVLKKHAQEFVDTLSAPEFMPTVWSEKDPPKGAFVPQAVVSTIRNQDMPYANLVRRIKPRWQGGYGSGKVDVKFGPSLQARIVPKVFSWSNQLADVLRPIYGVCHRILPRQKYGDEVDACGFIGAGEYLHYGPAWLGSRNYLGNELAEQIGVAKIREYAGSVVEHEWGLEVDLLTDPWNVGVEEFHSRQQEVMAVFSQTGLFGDYRQFPFPKAGSHWVYRDDE